MKKFVIYSIIIILIFLLSVYIGMKFEPKIEEEKVEEKELGSSDVKQETQIQEIEQAVSEDEIKSEHYVLKAVNKYIKVYSIGKDEKEELYLSTDISTEYLPETDKISLREGIHVYSKEELNEILQDFE